MRASRASIGETRNRLASDETYRALSELFGALADPTRVGIVHALSLCDLCTSELAEIVRVTESAVSQHLRVLRALRIVRARREGKYVYYSLDDAHVPALLGLGLAHQEHRERPLVGGAA